MYENSNPWDNTMPSSFIIELENKIVGHNKKIIDIGCGIGRNSFPFAKLGVEIDFLEISNKALKKVKESETKYDALFNYYNLDICKYSFKKNYYDLAIFYGVINSISKFKWKDLADRISNSLKDDAYLVVSAFTAQSTTSSVNEGIVDFAEPAEIPEFFNKLKIIKCDSRVLTHNHYPSGLHTHTIERYLFKKSNVNNSPHKSKIKIAPIGPTNPKFSATSLKIEKSFFYDSAQKLGHFISNNNCEFIGIPDKGLVKAAFDAYLEEDSSKPATIIVPKWDDVLSKRNTSWHEKIQTDYPNSNMNFIKDITWAEQVVLISKLADILVVLGHSCGSIIEIGWTKWTKKPIFASRDLTSQLPNELTDRIQYFDNTNFNDLLYSLERHIKRIRSE